MMIVNQSLGFGAIFVRLTLCGAMLLGPIPQYTRAADAPIVTDGRTQTTVNTSGNVTDITTQTISGINAFNSFENFNVVEDHTVNMVLPTGTVNLINTVSGKQVTNIDGTLNGVYKGQTGGNLFFLNPNGIMVGEHGTINVGSLGLMTASSSFVHSLFEDGVTLDSGVTVYTPNAYLTQQVLEGNVPLSTNGSIIVKGKINAGYRVQLLANQVEVGQGAVVRLDRQFRVPYNEIVNTDGIDVATDIQVEDDGSISILGSEDVKIAGTVDAGGIRDTSTPGTFDGGDVRIQTAGGVYNKNTSDYTQTPLFDDQGQPVMETVQETVKKAGTDHPLLFQSQEDANADDYLARAIPMDESGVPIDYTGDTFYRFVDIQRQAYDIQVTELGPDTSKHQITFEETARVKADGVGATAAGGNITVESDYGIHVHGTGTEAVFSASGGAQGKGGEVSLDGEVTKMNGNVFSDLNDLLGGSGTLATVRVTAKDAAWSDVYYFSQTTNTNSAINPSGSGFSTSDSDIEFSVSGNLEFENVRISTRKVSESDSDLALDVLWQVHTTADSIGDSGKVTIKAGRLILKNSTILTSAIGNNDYKAGDIRINLTDKKQDALSINDTSYAVGMQLTNTTLDAGKYTTVGGSPTSGGLVGISIRDNSLANIFDFGGRAGAGFVMDSSSNIAGGTVTIEARAASGTTLDTTDIDSQEKANFGVDLLNLIQGYLLSGIASGRNNQARAYIDVDGNIQASGNVDLYSFATADASISTFGLNLGCAVVNNEEHSNIVLGSNSRISGQNLSVNSELNTSVGASFTNYLTLPVFPFDVAGTLVFFRGDNQITFNPGAQLTAGGDLSVNASSTVTAGASVCTGGARDVLGVGIAILDVDVNTRVNLEAPTGSQAPVQLKANNLLSMNAESILPKSSVATVVRLGESYVPINDFTNKISKQSLDKLFGVIEKGLKKLCKLDPNGPVNAFDKLGFSMSSATSYVKASSIVDIGGGSVLTSQSGTLSLNAYTKSVYDAFAQSQIWAEFDPNHWGQKIQKKYAVAVGLPIVIQNNTTEVIVRENSQLRGLNVAINAKTENPYVITHPLVTLFTDYDSFAFMDLFDVLFSDTLYLQEGFISSGAQASAESKKLAVAGAFNFLFFDNTTTARVCDGVKISAESGGAADSVNVSAIFESQTVNTSGAIRSFIRSVGQPKQMGENVRQISNLQNMWGTSSQVGIGAGVLFNHLDNTTIARVDGGSILADDVTVAASSRILDIALAAGGGKASSFGFYGMADAMQLKNYTLAKIDDSVRIGTSSSPANSVAVTVDDQLVRVGMSGSVLLGEHIGVGVGMGFSILDREAYAVWGNLLNEDGTFATIRGDSSAETLASTAGYAWVNNKINVASNMNGVDVLYAVSGVFVSSSPEENVEDNAGGIEMGDLENGQEDVHVEVLKNMHGAFGISGDSAVAVVRESTFAQFNGNLDLHFNPNGTGVAQDEQAMIDVYAHNHTFHHLLAGSAAFQWGKTKSGSGGFAGSFVFAQTKGKTWANFGVHSATWFENLGNDWTGTPTKTKMNVEARKSGEIIPIAIGVEGAFTSSKTNIALAGSAAYAQISDNTRADFTTTQLLAYKAESNYSDALKAKFQQSVDATVRAQNTADIINLAGGVAMGGKVGVGAAAAVSYIDQNTNALIKDSELVLNDLLLQSTNRGLQVNVAAAAGMSGSSSSFSFGGALSINMISGTSQAGLISEAGAEFNSADLYGNLIVETNNSITTKETQSASAKLFSMDPLFTPEEKAQLDAFHNKTLYLGEDLETVQMEPGEDMGKGGEKMYTTFDVYVDSDSSKIVSVALGVGMTGASGGTAGASVGISRIATKHEAILQGVDILMNGNLAATSSSDGGIYTFGLGGGAGGSFSIGGTVGVALLYQNTFVTVKDSRITTRKVASSTRQDTFRALDRAVLISGSLAVAGSKTAGVSASVAYNQIGNQAIVQMDNAQITNRFGGIEILGKSEADLIALEIQVGIASSAGIAGNVAINSVGQLGMTDSSKRESDIQKALSDTYSITSSATHKHRSGVLLSNQSSLTAEYGNVDLTAHSTGLVAVVGLTVAGASTAAVGVSGSYANLGAATVLEIADSAITAHDFIETTADAQYDAALARSSNLTATQKTALREYYDQMIGSGTQRVAVASAQAGNVSLNNTDNSMLVNVLLGGAGSGSVGVYLNVGVNTIRQSLETYLKNATVTAGGNIQSHVANDGTFVLTAGNISIGGSGAGVGVNFVYNAYGSTAQHLTEGGKLTSGFGNVDVQAASRRESYVVSISGAGSGMVGVDANASVSYFTNKVLNTVTKGAQISAGGNVLLASQLADHSFNLTPTGAIGGTGGGVGGNVVVTVLKSIVQTLVDSEEGATPTMVVGSNMYEYAEPLSMDIWNDTGEKESLGIRGVGVIATNRQSIQSLSMVLAGGLYFGVSGGASTVVNNTTTESIVKGVTLNLPISSTDGGGLVSEGVQYFPLEMTFKNGDVSFAEMNENITPNYTQRAQVYAKNLNFVGAIAFGAGAVTLGIGVSTMDLSTTARLEDVKSNREDGLTTLHDVDIRANTSVMSTPALLSGSIGLVGINGGYGLLKVDGKTTAEIVGTSLNTHSLNLESNLNFDVWMMTNYIVGGGGAVNGACDQIYVTHNTTARIIRTSDSTETMDITTEDSFRVSANTYRNLYNYAFSEAAGGVAAVINVNVANIYGATLASIGDRVNVNARGNLTLASTDKTDFQTIIGQASVGLSGIGIGVDVLVARNSSLVQVGDYSQLTSHKKMSIGSNLTRNLSAYDISGSVGLGGLNATVTVLHASNEETADSVTISGTDYQILQEKPVQDSRYDFSKLYCVSDDSQGHEQIPDDLDRDMLQGKVNVSQELSGFYDTPDTYDSGISNVLNGVQLGLASRLRAYGDLSIEAKTRNGLDTTTVSAVATTSAGIGGAIGVVNFGGDTVIQINGDVLSDGNLSIAADEILSKANDTESRAKMTIGVGVCGLASVGAGVGVLRMTGNSRVEFHGKSADSTDTQTLPQIIGSGALGKAGKLKLTASSNHLFEVMNGQVQISAGGVGADVTNVKDTSSAMIAGYNPLFVHTIMGDIQIDAKSVTDYILNTWAGSGGLLLSAVGDESNLETTGTASVQFADNTSVRAGNGTWDEESESTLTGNLAINTQAMATAEVLAFGLDVSGGVSIGVSRAISRANLDSRISFGNDSLISGGLVSLVATTNQSKLDVSSTAGGGSLLGAGNSAEAYSRGTHNATITFGNRFASLAREIPVETEESAMTYKARTFVASKPASTGVGVGALAVGVAQTENDFTTNSKISFGSGANLDAPSVKMSVENDSDLSAAVTAGSGGGVDVSASILKNYYTIHSDILFGADSQITADQILLDTLAGGKIHGFNDGFKGGLVNGGGGTNLTTVTAGSHVNLGDIQMTGNDIHVTALTKIDKPDHGRTMYLASGGLVDVSVGKGSITKFIVDTGVTLGDGAHVSTSANTLDGRVELLAMNDLSAYEQYDLNSGGLITVSEGDCYVNVEKLDAVVRVGKNAQIFSSGNLTLAAMSNAKIRVELAVNAYGLAGHSGAQGTLKVASNNDVTLDDNAQLLSWGNLVLGTGTRGGDTLSNWNVDGAFHVFDGTVAPIMPTCNVDYLLDVRNNVTLGVGSSARAVGNVELISQAGTVRSVCSQSVGNTYYNNSSSTVRDIFVDSRGHLARGSDQSKTRFTGGITVGGLVAAGIHAETSFRIDAEGNVEKSDWVKSSFLENQDLSASYDEQIAVLQQEKEAFGNDLAYQTAIQKEIDFLKTLQARYQGVLADVWVIHPVRTAGGDILVHGNFLATTGSNAQLVTRGTPTITVTNESGAFLQLDGLEIFESGKGLFSINGNYMLTAQEIDTFNKNSGTGKTAQFQTIDLVQGTGDDQIIDIRSKSAHSTHKSDLAPELWIYGNLSNQTGIIKIRSVGSIHQSGTISARTVEISTSGDYTQTYTEGVTNIGGNPSTQTVIRDLMDDFIAEEKSDGYSEFWNNLEILPNSAVVAGGSVLISAQYLNLNGVIASGYSNFDINLDTPEIRAAITDFLDQYSRDPGTGSTLDLSALVANQQSGFMKGTPVTKVEFDASSLEFSVGDMTSRGGNISLFGSILSTGNGILYAQDGYSDVNVTNPFEYRLNLEGINVSTSATGLITITDSSYAPFTYVDANGTKVTTYPTVQYRNEGGVLTKYTLQPDGTYDDGVASSTYKPQANRWYSWATQQKTDYTQDEEQTREYIIGIPSGEVTEESKSAAHAYQMETLYSDTIVESEDLDSSKDFIAKYFWGESDSKYTDWEYLRDGTRVIFFYWEEIYGRTHTWRETQSYYYYLNASKDINIQMGGNQTPPNVNIQSVGAVNMNGSIENLLGKVNITSDAAITRVGSSAYIASNNVDLVVNASAKSELRGIGTESTPILIRQSDPNSILNIAATNGDVYISNPYDNLVLNEITVSAGRFSGLASKDLVQTSTGLITARGVSLQSNLGTVGTADTPVRIETYTPVRTNALEGNVNAKARGDIHLYELSAADGGLDNPMYVGNILSSGGNVSLKNLGGGIWDGTATQVSETRSPGEYEEWLREKGIIAGDAYDELMSDTLEGTALRFTTDYHEYWEYGRNPHSGEFDPNYEFHFTAEQRAGYLERGISEDQLVAEEARQTDFYFNVLYSGGADSVYDPNFEYQLSSTEVDSLKRGSLREHEELLKMLPFDTYSNENVDYSSSEPTDNEAADYAENMTANILGTNIQLTTSQDIGERYDSLDFVEGTNFDDLTNDEIAIMQLAKPEDVTYYTDVFGKKHMVINRYNQLVVQTSGTLTAQATGNIYLGSTDDLTVQTLTAGGNLRMIVNGNLSANSPLVAKNMDFHAYGNLGDDSQLLEIDMRGDAPVLNAWALGYVNMRNLGGTTRVTTVESANAENSRVRLESVNGSILGVGAPDKGHFVADSVTLEATNDTLGAADSPLVFAPQNTETVVAHLLAGTLVNVKSVENLDLYVTQPVAGDVHAVAMQNLTQSGTVEGQNIVLDSVEGELIQNADSVLIASNQIDLSAQDNVNLACVRISGETTVPTAITVTSRSGAIVRAGAGTTIAGDHAQLALSAAFGVGNAENPTGSADALALEVAELTAIVDNGGFHATQASQPLLVKNVQVGNGPVALDSTGDLTIQTVTTTVGDIFLTGRNISLEDQVSAGTGNVYLLAQENLTTGEHTPTLAGTDVYLAANGEIGSSANPFNLSASGKTHFYGKRNVYLNFAPGDVAIDELYTEGLAQLRGVGSADIRDYTGSVLNSNLELVHIHHASQNGEFSFQPAPDTEVKTRDPLAPTDFSAKIRVDSMTFVGPKFTFDEVELDKLHVISDSVEFEKIEQLTKDGSIPLTMSFVGYTQNMAQLVNLHEVVTYGGAQVEKIHTTDGLILVTNGPYLEVEDGLTDHRVRLNYLDMPSQIDASDKTAFNDRTHLWTRDGRFRQHMTRDLIDTNIYVLNYDSDYIINRIFSTENSLERLTNKEFLIDNFPHLYIQRWHVEPNAVYIPEEED